MSVSLAVFLVLWIGLSAAGLNLTLQFLRVHGVEGVNYRHERIPVGMGLFLWACVCLECWLAELWEAWNVPLPSWLTEPDLSYYFMLTVVFVAGWIDDTLGDPHVKGLKGHLRRFAREGVITSGLAKAGMVSLAALWAASTIAASFWRGVLVFCVLVLTTNAVNLLDLRPARALKGLFAASLILMAVSLELAAGYLLPVLAGGLLVFGYDLKAKAMLGDAGANLLGFSLGYTAGLMLPDWGLLLWFTCTAVLHWIAERMSLSRIIERNRLLSWLDQAGRDG